MIIPHQQLTLVEFKRMVQSAFEDLYRWITVGTTGNVGIGTTSPASQLSIYHATNPEIRLTNATTGNTSNDGSVIYGSGSDFALVNKESGKLQLGTTNTVRVAIPAAGIAEYADNAAALAGGLVAGDLYRTGDALKIVHS